MANSISKVVTSITSVLSSFQIKRLLSVVLVGFLLLTTNVAFGKEGTGLSRKIDADVQRNDSQRPKTTGEWNAEANEDASLGKRVNEIAKESAEAVKDFGKVYPDTAKRSARALEENADQRDNGFFNRS